MPTKTTTRPRTAGTLAVDRIEYRKTDRKTRIGSPVSLVIVDGVELGEVAKAQGSGWLHTGPGVERTGYYLPKTKPEAAARLVTAALAAGTIRDMDDEAAGHAAAAAALVEPVSYDSNAEEWDETNRALAAEAVGRFALHPGIRTGDVVRFADGIERRAVTVYARNGGAQTSHGGSFRMGTDGGTDYSGGLCRLVPGDKLTETDETASGTFWTFSHGIMGAHRGVTFRAPVRVFLCSDPSTAWR